MTMSTLIIVVQLLIILRLLYLLANGYGCKEDCQKIFETKEITARAWFEQLKSKCAPRYNRDKNSCAGCPDYELCTDVTVGAPADWDVDKILSYGKGARRL